MPIGGGFSIGINFFGLLWGFVVLSALALVLIFFTNRFSKTDPTVLSREKYMIMIIRSLRTIAAVLLLLLIFDPEIHVQRQQVKPKQIAVLLDNSRSMSNAWEGDEDVLNEKIRDILQSMNETGNLQLWTMSGHSFSGGDALAFDENSTTWLWPKPDNEAPVALSDIQTVVLISDGYLNTGRSPLDMSWITEIPVYPVLPLEARTSYSLKIRSCYIDMPVRLNEIRRLLVEVHHQGLQGQNVLLTVKDNQGNTLAASRRLFRHSVESYDLPLSFDQEGEHQLIVRVSDEGKKVSDSFHLNVSVKDPVRDILIISEQLTPLLRFIKMSYPDSLYTLHTITGLSEKTMISSTNLADLPDIDMLIVFMGKKLAEHEKITRFVKEKLEEDIPLILFNSGQDNLSNHWRSIWNMNAVRAKTPGNSCTAFLPSEVNSHPLQIRMQAIRNRNPGVTWETLPPVRAPETWLSFTGVRFLETLDGSAWQALISFHDFLPRVIFNGSGYWRWFFHSPEYNVFDVFWKELNTYLFSMSDFRPVELLLVDRVIPVGTDISVQIRAREMDGSPLRDGIIRLKQHYIETNASVPIPTEKQSDGYALGRIQTRESGNYSLAVEIERSGQIWGQDSLHIQVIPFDAEDQTRGVNQAFLELLAKRSGGKVLTFQDAKTHEFRQESYLLEEEWNFTGIRWLGSLVILVTVLLIEWVYRRRKGLL